MPQASGFGPHVSPRPTSLLRIGDIILEVAGSGLEATAICNTVDKINTR